VTRITYRQITGNAVTFISLFAWMVADAGLF
jgi:hypothetical protein